MDNYLTPSQPAYSKTSYNDLSTVADYSSLATSALASSVNNACGLDPRYKLDLDSDIKERITETESMFSTPELRPDNTKGAEAYPEAQHDYYSSLDLNDQNVFPLGSSEKDLYDSLYNDPHTPEIKKKYSIGHLLSSNQPSGDIANDQPAKDSESISTQESSPERGEHEEDDYLGSSLKSYPVSSGLPNLGNTCYMNSVLQCLFNTEKLCSLLEKNKQYIEKEDRAPLTNRFMEAISSAFTNQSSTRNMAKPLMTFKSALEKVAPIFKGYSQNDAHELFRLLVEKMHDELNHAPRKSGSYVEFTPRDTSDVHGIAEEWKHNSKERDDSLLTSLFGGILLTEVKCNHCGHVSYTFEDALDLSLNLANLRVEDSDNYDSATKLDTCLKDFAASEFVDGYACDKCKRRDSSYKRTAVWKQPEVLVLQLKRFVYDLYGEREAVKDAVSFPLEDLTLDEITHEKSNEKRERYQLYGIVNHFGGLDSGHYIAFIYNDEQQCWYQYNDSHVTRMDKDDMVEFARGSSEPYILFYRKV